MKSGSGSEPWLCQQGDASQLGKAWGWQTLSTGIWIWQHGFHSWGEHQRVYEVQPNSSTGRNCKLNKGQIVLCSATCLKIPLCPRYNGKFNLWWQRALLEVSVISAGRMAQGMDMSLKQTFSIWNLLRKQWGAGVTWIAGTSKQIQSLSPSVV